MEFVRNYFSPVFWPVISWKKYDSFDIVLYVVEHVISTPVAMVLGEHCTDGRAISFAMLTTIRRKLSVLDASHWSPRLPVVFVSVVVHTRGVTVP